MDAYNKSKAKIEYTRSFLPFSTCFPNQTAMGICNHIGNVFGMMPHPERTFYRYQHSDWPETGLKDNYGDGKAVFESVLDYISKRF